MGKSLAAAFASGRWRAPAWLAEAGGALARIVLPAGCRLCEQLLTGASRLPVCEDCLASFPRIRGSVCRECGVLIDSVSGDEDSDGAGPGELFEDVCLGCRSEKFHFDRARSFARYQGSLVRAMVLLEICRDGAGGLVCGPAGGSDWGKRYGPEGRPDRAGAAAQDRAARAA